jgi:hypothetical protein
MAFGSLQGDYRSILDINSFSRSLEHPFAYSLTQLLSASKKREKGNPKTIRESYNFCLSLLMPPSSAVLSV